MSGLMCLYCKLELFDVKLIEMLRGSIPYSRFVRVRFNFPSPRPSPQGEGKIFDLKLFILKN
jgi:hypothetical protein